jgi:DNA-binding FadR family transcriptional regulator
MRCFELRVGLEGEAAFLAAERRGPEDLLELKRALRELERAIARREVGADADLRFHAAVAHASKNKLFGSTMEALGAHVFSGMKVARNLSLQASLKRLHLVQDEHRTIFAAIAAQDGEAAREAMRQHIGNARVRILSDSAEPS